MVGDYSNRALSVHSDKLLAVAGLASLMQKNYNLTYATGLWEEDLPIGLCWSVIPQNDTVHKKEVRPVNEDDPDYLAPTWSWASVRNKPVHFVDTKTPYLHEEGMQVLGLETAHLPGALAPYGGTTYAKLTISVRMRKVVLVPPRAGLSTPTPYGESNEDLKEDDPIFRPVAVVDPLTESVMGYATLDSLKVYGDVSKQYRESQRDTNSSSTTESIVNQASCIPRVSHNGFKAWCVPCVVRENGGYHYTIALVLTLSNAERQEYCRIGIMFIRVEDLFPMDNLDNPSGDERKDFETIHVI
ncbi:hypothetical protein G6011_01281 [Alternaria panax]|uniref:Heterokaryon incompatibility protein n=1 Tax=Alternaria panax TaxID=48097 RepID=A0AAD4IKI3_9PLEO|nr:hypothetical protein G6011_01281 [Alternaria panax]